MYSLQTPFLMDDGETRSLHFDFKYVQSEMRIDAPIELLFGYTQAMMAFLLINPTPENILLVGLGGGSLSKYCHHLLPQTIVTTVEINEDVILLRDSFHIPPDSESFNVVHDDAANYLRHQHQISDIILLDGYTTEGLPRMLTTPMFYKDCYNALNDGGILVANFNCEDVQLATCMGRLLRIFKNKVLVIKSNTSGNKVVFAFKGHNHLPIDLMAERAEQLQQQTQLPMLHFYEQIVMGCRPWLIPHENRDMA